MTNLRAQVIHIQSEPGEIHFLVRGQPPGEDAGPADPVDKRIILSPFAAKRLVFLLDAAVGDHEAQYGPMTEEPRKKPGSEPVPEEAGRRGILETVQGEKARRLIRVVEGLGIHYAFEQSFKMLDGALLGNRFLAGFNKSSIQQGLEEKLTALCRGIDMPESRLREFLRGLPEANIILFGYEEGEGRSVYKAYLEFGRALEQVQRNPGSGSAPILIHRGFKWDAENSARHTTALYKCHPSWPVETILRRVADVFYGDGPGTTLEIVRGIVDLASRRMRPEEFLYLEVEEEGNPRLSYDINLYHANLLLGELYPFLLAMCRRYAIPVEVFHRLYEPVKSRIFGHVSGGIDRHGRDFLTVYYGVKGSSRPAESG